MAASSSSVFLAMRDEAVNHDNQMKSLQQQQQQQQQILPPPPNSQQSSNSSNKKRRNLPGNPNPDAEVIALSPKTLMATNRFVCEVCNKGFQREQNLQLHRRGHNLPWKLRQKTSKDQVKRKVYLCPEPTCVHHDPSRALGDLTGIKKHYSRKHGEKKYKCDKCSKKYAVHSDWKAHSKTCGTKEYRCDCGTLFSRRDSFITHRAFCDALAQESARNLNAPLGSINGSHHHLLGLSSQTQDHHHHHHHHHQALSSHDLLQVGSRARPSSHFETLLNQQPGGGYRAPQDSPTLFQLQGNHEETSHGLLANKPPLHGLMQLPLPQLGQIANANASASSTAAGLFNLSFFPTNTTNGADPGIAAGEADSTLFPSGNLMGIAIPSLYSASPHGLQNPSSGGGGGGGAAMSATALLQKAAQIGSTTSNTSSLLKSLSKDSHGGGLNFGANNGSQMQDLMNSISSSSIFTTAYSQQDQQQQQLEDYSRFHDHHQNNNNNNNNNTKVGGGGGGGFDDENNDLNIAGGDGYQADGRLTRDFLGVGEIVRTVRDQNNNGGGIDMEDAMDINLISSQTHAAFAKGNNFQ
ncbi:protein indeterminate-domain 4, chloroplastic-like [Andrographis paniculata]|uniref:protein indeterminate-domain 4, chloroplastic-like n=1 Tax=Andrographis paniculata TaxID=175694 RepID=UPI0021E6F92B|nr:protein indeterminate-domain 4, chloroplastic-like [Andrographis paniculata]